MSIQGVRVLQTELMAIAEKLAQAHSEMPAIAVAETVSDCADEFPDGDSLLVEQAARARLDDQCQAPAWHVGKAGDH